MTVQYYHHLPVLDPGQDLKLVVRVLGWPLKQCGAAVGGAPDVQFAGDTMK